ncbi:hypothetical protein SAMN04515691_1730 [Leifsonia sp. 98AMF]|uniref:hypothetical protein n=1 Tax=unclassified Leifsonia TaxID=2663824 RepID=UPI00087A9C46|nr:MULTISPECIES: hypothetical protein [unclassified Leifsonia]SDH38135.1 hypothetical protein SAMN04515690_2289 [Leifsonia sp. 197AMF]SDI97924.1 hypothetical protein SAMN04515684_1497 [Leifsonia sp. 466MF]SDJ77109.1 hypothetical protein SAMN04515683_1251 [Leifsonia sp. 157MF]SDO01280.1 hypothetical protein SAMN04515686_3700 [Leifsonia sp. 509MF]SEN02767.1 hypothetical protein SAMN04515685_1236 [Leifsonia sp. 467MF]
MSERDTRRTPRSERPARRDDRQRVAPRPKRLPPRLLRRLILSALLGVAVGLAAWWLGMDEAHATGLGAAALAFTACLSALGEAADLTWPPAAPPLRPGSRRDVVALGWSLSSRGGRASPEGLRALRSVAERALRLRGLDLEDRAADAQLEELLGPDILALLRRGSVVTSPRTSQIGAVLDRLEQLVPQHTLSVTRMPTTHSPEEPTRAR